MGLLFRIFMLPAWTRSTFLQNVAPECMRYASPPILKKCASNPRAVHNLSLQKVTFGGGSLDPSFAKVCSLRGRGTLFGENTTSPSKRHSSPVSDLDPVRQPAHCGRLCVAAPPL